MTVTTRTTRFCERVRQVLGCSETRRRDRFRRWRNREPTTTIPVQDNTNNEKLGCFMVEWHIASQLNHKTGLAAQGTRSGHKKRFAARRKEVVAQADDTQSTTTCSVESQNDQMISDMLEMIDQYLACGTANAKF